MRYILFLLIFFLASPANAATLDTPYFSLELPEKFVYIEGSTKEKTQYDGKATAFTAGKAKDGAMLPDNVSVILLEYWELKNDQQFSEMLTEMNNEEDFEEKLSIVENTENFKVYKRSEASEVTDTKQNYYSHQYLIRINNLIVFLAYMAPDGFDISLKESESLVEQIRNSDYVKSMSK